MSAEPPEVAPWRDHLHEVIFEADTPAGKAFDVILLIAILVSVLFVVLESVDTLRAEWLGFFRTSEWILTILFTIEYVLRLICVRRPLRYARSFFGIVDLLAILPTYLSLFFAGAQMLLVIRALRLLRVFRVFKLARFLSEADMLLHALRSSRPKIIVFLTAVLITVTIMSSAMHLVEYVIPESRNQVPNEGFADIPQSLYWGIVTLTTVGYGDAAPETAMGKALASLMMIVGYSMLIVPTGIVSAELVQKVQRSITTQSCPSCSREGHNLGAVYCQHCGATL